MERDLRATSWFFAFVWLLALWPAGAGAEAPDDLARNRNQVVWLDFWASWCTPCRQSFPWMNAMQKKYAAYGLTVVAVNLDGDRKDADRFLATTPAEFTLEFDPDGDLAKRYEVEAMPSSYVLDRSGRIAARHLGFKPSKEREYEASIRATLGLKVE